MSEFIYVLRPTRLAMLTDGPTPQEAATIEEHARHLERSLEEGVALEVTCA